MSRFATTADPPNDDHPLPGWLVAYTKYAVVGLVAGTILCLFALFTNPVPDPSFPWFSLPESYRLPVTQPRIEHWPVTYTLGIWLWIIGFPVIFLAGYSRYRDRLGSQVWLVGLPSLAMLGWTTYCRFFWPKLQPPTWNAPSYTVVCWLYCSSYDALWSNLAYAIALLGITATFLGMKRWRGVDFIMIAFGVLAFPLGIPALFEAYQRTNSTIS